jgi:hypothetical protein
MAAHHGGRHCGNLRVTLRLIITPERVEVRLRAC